MCLKSCGLLKKCVDCENISVACGNICLKIYVCGLDCKNMLVDCDSPPNYHGPHSPWDLRPPNYQDPKTRCYYWTKFFWRRNWDEKKKMFLGFFEKKLMCHDMILLEGEKRNRDLERFLWGNKIKGLHFGEDFVLFWDQFQVGDVCEGSLGQLEDFTELMVLVDRASINVHHLIEAAYLRDLGKVAPHCNGQDELVARWNCSRPQSVKWSRWFGPVKILGTPDFISEKI